MNPTAEEPVTQWTRQTNNTIEKSERKKKKPSKQTKNNKYKKELNTNYPHKYLSLWTHKRVYESCRLILVNVIPQCMRKQVETALTLNTSNHKQHNLYSNHPVNVSQV